CVANDPYSVGAASASGWNDFNPVNDRWYVIPITVPTTATVSSMRMIVRNGVGGAQGRMALWQDNGGAPGACVAMTNNTALSSAGVVSGAPTVTTQVTGGTTYWIGAKFTGSAQLYQNPSTTQDGYFLSETFSSNPAALDPFPSGSAGALSNVGYNFYLVVQNVSQ